MKNKSFPGVVLLLLLLVAAPAFAAQTLFPAGTPLNSTNNYSWRRMTTINVDSGQFVPFVAYSFNTIGAPAGNYTFTMTTVGFAGAINMYGVSFDPTFPQANFWQNGVVGGGAGTISQVINLPANQFFEIVFSAATAGSAGTFTASVSGPGNLALTQPSSLSIRVQPQSQTITSGNSANLSVYAVGPLPHTWQWYQGTRPNTNSPIAGATTPYYNTGSLINSNSYWVRVRSGNTSNNSSTAVITLTGNPNADYSGTLSPGGCTLQNGALYNTQGFQIQQAGNYTFTLTAGFTLAIYQGSFDPLQPLANYFGTGNGSYLQGNYIAVISKASPGGAFTGAIGGGPSVVALTPAAPPSFISSPSDVTIQTGGTATLAASMTCGTPFSLQWYRGASGDTSNPVAGATSPSYTTPTLVANTQYWLRMTWATGTNNSGAATVFVVNGAVTRAGTLNFCDPTFNRPTGPGVLSGQVVAYEAMKFIPSVGGSYTFTTTLLSGNMNVRSTLYGGVFDPANPLANLYAVTNSPNALSATLLANNTYYLVISADIAGRYGFFDTAFSGPALVTLRPLPVIASQPSTVAVLRGQTATFTVTSPTPNVSYQWFAGSDCNARTAISNATSSSYTTPALTDHLDYLWVELTSDGGKTLSTPMAGLVRPQVFNDMNNVYAGYTLTVPPPGLFANDLKGDSRTLSIDSHTAPNVGTLFMFGNGGYTYTAPSNFTGTATFTYQATDGRIASAVPATVSIAIIPSNSPPTAVTLAATGVSATTATMNGTVNPGSVATAWSFHRGTNVSYGSNTPVSTTAGHSTNQPVSIALNGLVPGRTYHYRLVGTNSLGTSLGSNVTFTTEPLLIVTPPANTAACVGGAARFEVVANAPGATYQWQRRNPGAVGFNNLGGANASILDTPPVTAADDGAAYRVIVSAPGTNVTSGAALLSVISLPAPTVTYDFNSGLPPDTAIYGSAFVSNGELVLTPVGYSLQGGFLTADLAPGRVVRGFAATFKLRVAQGSGLPADGFSFNWAGDLPNDSAGEEGAGSGLTVSFDIYDNDGGEAPAIDVKWNSNVVSHTVVPLSFISDFSGSFRTASLRVNSDGTLDLIYNCQPLLTRFPLPGYAPQLGGRFLLGARTGGEFAAHSVDDFAVQLDLDPTNGVPRLTGVKTNGAGGLTIHGTGTPGATLALNAATNQAGSANWSFRATVVPDGSGVFAFNEPDISTPVHRFYKLAGAAQLPTNLVTWWRAESNYLDSFGGDHGSATNLGFAAGQRGQSFSFDGTNQTMTIGGAPVPVPWTAAFWVKRQDASDLSAALLTDDFTGLKLEQYGSATRVVGFTQFGVADYYYTNTVPSNVWTHVTFVATGGGTALYFNGVQVESIPASVSLPRGFLGARSNLSDRLRGQLDEITLFNRALTPAEIQQVLNATRGP